MACIDPSMRGQNLSSALLGVAAAVALPTSEPSSGSSAMRDVPRDTATIATQDVYVAGCGTGTLDGRFSGGASGLASSRYVIEMLSTPTIRHRLRMNSLCSS
jgi:hypothetical protein